MSSLILISLLTTTGLSFMGWQTKKKWILRILAFAAQDPDLIKDLLVQQVTKCVRWTANLDYHQVLQLLILKINSANLVF